MSESSKRFKKVYVEIGNSCNLQCSFCPEVERPKKQLDESSLRKTLSQVKTFAERICFHVMGEPLSHPRFAEFVHIAQELQVPLEITTNGTLLGPANQKALLSACIDQVNFSLQSFLDNYPNADPLPYFKKILDFTELALKERPELYINFRLWNLREGEREDARNEVLLALLEERFGLAINRRVDPKLTKSKRLQGRLYLHYDTRFEWPNSQNPEEFFSGTCYGTRSHVAILAEGTVVPCCLDKEDHIPLGSLHSQSFEEIITGPRIEAMRQGFETGKRVEEFCRRCRYAQRFMSD